MTIGWEEVAAATGAEMVGGDLIKHTPETGHVKLGGKDEKGQFTFTDAGQSIVLDMMAGVEGFALAVVKGVEGGADAVAKAAAKAAKAIEKAQAKAAAALANTGQTAPADAPVVENAAAPAAAPAAPAPEPEGEKGLFDEDEPSVSDLLDNAG